MLFPLLLLTVFAADMNGTWTGEPAPGHTVKLVLHQNATAVSGTLEIQGRVLTLENVKVEGDTINYTVAVPAAGRLIHAAGAFVLKDGYPRMNVSGPEFAMTPTVFSPEAVRLERLSAVIRLWGAIHYFHPYVASRAINWDEALFQAMKQLGAGTSHEEFVLILSGMLAPLNDSDTRVLGANEPEPVSVACQCRRIVRSGYFGRTSPTYYADWETVRQSAPYVMGLSEEIRVAIRTAEPEAGQSAVFQRGDEPYDEEVPSREQRLLGLARYWNTIHYFYGYPEALDAWESALTESISPFEQADTRRDYLFAILRLASRTHDGHSSFNGSTASLIGILGKTPNVALRNLGDRVVVTASADAALRRGDVIQTINGKPALEQEGLLMSLIPHSTPQCGRLLAAETLLAGPEPTVRVGVQRSNAKEETLTLDRNVQVVDASPGPSVRDVFTKLPSGLGYIDLTRLKAAELDRAFDSVMDAPGLILDLRGYAMGIFPTVAGRLAQSQAAAAVFRQRVWHGPDPAAVTEDGGVQYAAPSGKPVYRGRVAVLIDERAFSQGEHTALFLRAATRVAFVGTPTSGNDGDVTFVTLPGAVEASFTGENVRQGDGAPLQRVGIIPDVWVEPTVEGVRTGQDEVLERAVAVLLGK
jgi:C-terminal processing protease CtpA/Prc